MIRNPEAHFHFPSSAKLGEVVLNSLVVVSDRLRRTINEKKLKKAAVVAAAAVAVTGLTYKALNPSHPGARIPGASVAHTDKLGGVGVAEDLSNPNRQLVDAPNTYTVQAGDTEWRLANMIAPNADTRAEVYEIDQMLPPDSAHAGHTLQPGDTVTYNDGKILSYSGPSSSDS